MIGTHEHAGDFKEWWPSFCHDGRRCISALQFHNLTEAVIEIYYNAVVGGITAGVVAAALLPALSVSRDSW